MIRFYIYHDYSTMDLVMCGGNPISRSLGYGFGFGGIFIYSNSDRYGHDKGSTNYSFS